MSESIFSVAAGAAGPSRERASATRALISARLMGFCGWRSMRSRGWYEKWTTKRGMTCALSKTTYVCR
jgi:hypothetical protein